MKAKKWVYAKKFSGVPDMTNFRLEEENLSDDLKDGEILCEAIFWSVDPYMRIFSEKVGDVMIGEQIARVTKSKDENYPVDTLVSLHAGWRTHTVVSDTSTLNKLPDMDNLPKSLALGVLGMPGRTAYFGLLEKCRPKPGETVLVSTAAGAVGNVVGQIAKIKGCKVIACAGTGDKCRWLKEDLKFEIVFNYKTTALEDVLKEYGGGIDCYFDNVGGEFLHTAVRHMNDGGRVVICGHIGDYNAAGESKGGFPHKLLLYKGLTVSGIRSVDHMEKWPEARGHMLEWIQQGKLQYKETTTTGFENMPAAFLGLFDGANIGKKIVKA